MNLKAFIRFLKTSPLMMPALAAVNAVLWLTDTLAIYLTPRPETNRPTLLIIRLDVLGDYLMFRPYLRLIRASPQYRNHRFVLCGNVAVKSLAEPFDSEVVDQFLWADIYKLSTRPFYRFRFVRQLRRAGADVVFGPTYSRVLVLDDFMARASGAAERVGCQTDYINLKRWEAALGNRLYTRLIASGNGILFEGERDRRIAEGFLQTPVAAQSPVLDVQKAQPISLPDRFVVLSLGAGQDFRVWPADRFVAVANVLRDEYTACRIVLTGAPNEMAYARVFLDQFPQPAAVLDLTGKLSIPQLVYVLAKADLLIANETGIVHLAASTGVPTLVISQGKSLVRWHPYPAHIANRIQYLYPDYVEQHRANLTAIAPEFNPESPYPITAISTERVLASLSQLMPHSTSNL